LVVVGVCGRRVKERSSIDVSRLVFREEGEWRGVVCPCINDVFGVNTCRVRGERKRGEVGVRKSTKILVVP
jgi:hypothetical protein